MEETREKKKRQINTTSSVWWTHSDHAKDFAVFHSKTHTWDRTENIFHKCIFQMRNKRQEVKQQNNLQHHKLSPTSLLLSSLKGEQKRL